jgi:hypothetical protein
MYIGITEFTVSVGGKTVFMTIAPVNWTEANLACKEYNKFAHVMILDDFQVEDITNLTYFLGEHVVDAAFVYGNM